MKGEGLFLRELSKVVIDDQIMTQTNLAEYIKYYYLDALSLMTKLLYSTLSSSTITKNNGQINIRHKKYQNILPIIL